MICEYSPTGDDVLPSKRHEPPPSSSPSGAFYTFTALFEVYKGQSKGGTYISPPRLYVWWSLGYRSVGPKIKERNRQRPEWKVYPRPIDLREKINVAMDLFREVRGHRAFPRPDLFPSDQRDKGERG
jgi:hypothetical protein